MSASPPSPFRVVSFGDLDGEIWGTAIDAGDPAIVFATPDGTHTAAGRAEVQIVPEGQSWRIAGDGFELLVTPAREDDEEPRGDDGELCHVTGTLTVGGAERSVRCVGTRGGGDGLDLERLDSVRGLSGWFHSDRAVMLLSFRPRRSAGQERDLVAATVFEPEGRITVEDARLSTTYTAAGAPARASLELWIGDGEEQHPRRAAAEARGDAAGVDVGRLRLGVTPLRYHTGGREGTGVYVLARF